MRGQSSGGGTGVVREDIEICNCTNTQLERGETCGLAICPNNPAKANSGPVDRAVASRQRPHEPSARKEVARR